MAPGRFRTAFAADADSVFVYGREVKDFRMVDYEALAMLNVSATQALLRRLEKQAADHAAQAQTLASQAAAIAAQSAHIAELSLDRQVQMARIDALQTQVSAISKLERQLAALQAAALHAERFEPARLAATR